MTRLGVGITFFVLHLIYYQAFSQKQHITVGFGNIDLETALDELSQLTGFLFSYNPDNFPQKSKVKASYDKQPLESILKDILDPLNLEYLIMQNMVIISPKEKKKENLTIPKKETPTEQGPGELTVRDDLLPEGELKEDNALTIVHDTVRIPKIVYDTVKVVETIHDTIRNVINEKHYDTVQVIKTVTKYDMETGPFSMALGTGASIPVFQQKSGIDRNEGEYNITGNLSTSMRLYFLYERKKLGVALGLGASSFNFDAERMMGFSYAYYKVDTIESYYIIVDGEREYIHITDSTLQTGVEYKNIRGAVTAQCIDIPIHLTYRFDIGKKVSVWLGGEGEVSLFINKTDPERLLNPKRTPQFNYGLFLRAGYKLASNSNVFIEAKYRGRTSQMFEDLGYQSAFICTNLGLRFYF